MIERLNLGQELETFARLLEPAQPQVDLAKLFQDLRVASIYLKRDSKNLLAFSMSPCWNALRPRPRKADVSLGLRFE